MEEDEVGSQRVRWYSGRTVNKETADMDEWIKWTDWTRAPGRTLGANWTS